MDRKTEFAFWCINQRGKPVLWAMKGPGIFDCSGLVSCGIQALDGPDHRETWNAQRYADSSPIVSMRVEPGDFGFYGRDWKTVGHIVVALLDGHLVSADGASRSIGNLQEALARKCEVRLHDSTGFRKDEPFLGWRKNTLLE